MNRKALRDMRKACIDRLRKSKNFVLVTFDGEGLPVYSVDVGGCTNRGDTRHCFMRDLMGIVERGVKLIEEAFIRRVCEMEQAEAAESYKNKRSEELREIV